LAVYSYLYGELTPSVAFTAIGVFSNLEVTLAVIPELTTDLIDAHISVTRIERYLNAPEITKNTTDSPNISFDNASIAWPSDEEKTDNDLRYVLRNINVSFPENELSVVSGKTGTGKSLLLAAILGEVDVLSGKINVPSAPHTRDRHDNLATKDNWIIPSSIAFVAQIPWIVSLALLCPGTSCTQKWVDQFKECPQTVQILTSCCRKMQASRKISSLVCRTTNTDTTQSSKSVRSRKIWICSRMARTPKLEPMAST
jgi:energy-coupling factor transporter ATP-binding protein EcfA2